MSWRAAGRVCPRTSISSSPMCAATRTTTYSSSNNEGNAPELVQKLIKAGRHRGRFGQAGQGRAQGGQRAREEAWRLERQGAGQGPSRGARDRGPPRGAQAGRGARV